MKIKTLLATSLAITTLFSMTACGNDSKKSNEKDTGNTSVVTETTTVTENNESETEETTESNNSPNVEVITEVVNIEDDDSSAGMNDIDTVCDVKVLSHKLSSDMNGKPCLVIEYEWTNTGSSPATFMYSCIDTGTQNGEDRTTMVVGCEDLDNAVSDNVRMDEIPADETATIKLGYMLVNDADDVNLVVKNFDGSAEMINETLKLN
jgi:hypothetical protein